MEFNFGIILCESVRNCMLFADSLNISEVLHYEPYNNAIIFCCLVNKQIFEKDGCVLLMNCT